MKEMKTIKFPGDTEPREIVDAKARQEIGTADISAIGDGTVKGAIVALLAMVNSGGGTDGAAFEVRFGAEDEYAEAVEISYAEGEIFKKVSNEVPTLAQMQNCTMGVVSGNGDDFDITGPEVAEDFCDNGVAVYTVLFAKVNELASPNVYFIVSDGAGAHPAGVYVNFLAARGAVNDGSGIQEGVICFPKG